MDLLWLIVVQMKILLQELYEAELDWNQQLTGQPLEKWCHPSLKLHEARIFLTLRCYLVVIDELVMFYRLCGSFLASLKAYAVTIYMYLLVDTMCVWHIRITASKTPISPFTTPMIPWLELLSTVILGRIMELHKLLRVSCRWLSQTVSLIGLLQFSGTKEWRRVESHSSRIKRLKFRCFWYQGDGCIFLCGTTY